MSRYFLLQLRKNRLMILGFAAIFALSILAACGVAYLHSWSVKQVFIAYGRMQHFWLLCGFPLAVMVFSASAGAELASDVNMELETPLPVSPLEKFWAAQAANLVYLACFLLVLLLAGGQELPNANAAAQEFLRHSYFSEALGILIIAVCLCLPVSVFTCAYLLRNGMLGAAAGIVITAPAVFGAALLEYLNAAHGPRADYAGWNYLLLPLWLLSIGAVSLPATRLVEVNAPKKLPHMAAVLCALMFGGLIFLPPLFGVYRNLINAKWALNSENDNPGDMAVYMGNDGEMFFATPDGIRAMSRRPKTAPGFFATLLAPRDYWWLHREHSMIWRDDKSFWLLIRHYNRGADLMLVDVRADKLLFGKTFPKSFSLWKMRNTGKKLLGFTGEQKFCVFDDNGTTGKLRDINSKEFAAEGIAVAVAEFKAGVLRLDEHGKSKIWKLPGIITLSENIVLARERPIRYGLVLPTTQDGERVYSVPVWNKDTGFLAICRLDGTVDRAPLYYPHPVVKQTGGFVPSGAIWLDAAKNFEQLFHDKPYDWKISADAVYCDGRFIWLSYQDKHLVKADGKTAAVVAYWRLPALPGGGRGWESFTVPSRSGIFVNRAEGVYFVNWEGKAKLLPMLKN